MILTGKRVISLLVICSMFFVLVGCNATSFEGSQNVAEASELKELLNKTGTVVIDARSEEDYKKGHLEGAIHLPPSLLTISIPVSGTIAPKEKVEEVLSAKGISNDSHVFIYDNNGGVYASRVWWVLKVYGHENVKVMNNGETAIVDKKLNLPLTREILDVEKTTYEAKEMDKSLIATLDDVKAVVNGTAKACIIDVRSVAEYDEGAIPTAILYPHTKNLYVDGTFKSERDTTINYRNLGVNEKENIILYCKSSFRATQTYLLLNEAGYENVKIYDGAWLEWSTKDLPKTEKTENITTPSSGDGS